MQFILAVLHLNSKIVQILSKKSIDVILYTIHAQVGGRMGGDNFPLGKIFQEFLGGRKIFPPLFLVNFDVFLVDFDAKTQTGGENMPKIQNGGRKKEGGTDP